MHYHVRIHHWVVEWFLIGVVCGIVALVNILARTLSPTQVDLTLFFGVLYWGIGGVICYAHEHLKIEQPMRYCREPSERGISEQREWHAASDFLLPGNRKSLMPPRY
jgi:hypothetical protein